MFQSLHSTQTGQQMADRKEVSSAIPADIAERISDVGDGIVPTADEIETARGEIVETIMLFGQWPQPRPESDHRMPHRVQFLLSEFIANRENPDVEELAQFMVLAITNRHGSDGYFVDSCNRWEEEITEQLEAHFTAEHPLVVERAQDIAWEADSNRRELAEEGRRGL